MLKYIVLATALLNIFILGCTTEKEKILSAEAAQVAQALEWLKPPHPEYMDRSVCDHQGDKVRQIPTVEGRMGALMDMGFEFELGCNPERLGRPCQMRILNETLVGLWHDCPPK